MALYELAENYRMLQAMLDDDEVDEQAIIDTIEAMEGEFDEAADNIACLIKTVTYETEAMAAEIKKLQERKRIKENKSKRIKEYLLENMQKINRTKIETARNRISIRKNPASLIVTNISALQDNIGNWKSRKWNEDELDKTKIKERLNAGETIEGVRLESSVSLTIK